MDIRKGFIYKACLHVAVFLQIINPCQFLYTCCKDFKFFKWILSFLVKSIVSLISSEVFPLAGAASLQKKQDIPWQRRETHQNIHHPLSVILAPYLIALRSWTLPTKSNTYQKINETLHQLSVKYSGVFWRLFQKSNHSKK